MVTHRYGAGARRSAKHGNRARCWLDETYPQTNRVRTGLPDSRFYDIRKAGCGAPVRYDPVADAYEHPPARLALSGSFTLAGRDGPIASRPAFELFAGRCRAMPLERAAVLSGVEPATIRECPGRDAGRGSPSQARSGRDGLSLPRVPARSKRASGEPRDSSRPSAS